MANKFVTILACICGVLNLLPAIAYTTDGPFVKIQGTQFTLDGYPFLFNGFNSYWLMHMAAGPEQDRNKVANVLSEAAANGLTVCRTWAFSDGGDRALQSSPGVYDEHVFQVFTYQKIKTACILYSLVHFHFVIESDLLQCML